MTTPKVELHLTLKVEQYQQIEAAARREGGNVSKFVRNAALRRAIRVLAPTTPDAAPSDAPDEGEGRTT